MRYGPGQRTKNIGKTGSGRVCKSQRTKPRFKLHGSYAEKRSEKSGPKRSSQKGTWRGSKDWQ